MAEAAVLEGTGAELREHLDRHPNERFRLVPLPGEDKGNGSVAGPDKPEEQANNTLDVLMGRVPPRPKDPDAWRKTIGMFKDNPLMDLLDAAEIRARERDFQDE